MNFNFKEKYDINDLVSIIKLLRSPEGCHWDRQQDHKSIRSNFLEECYEAVEAIDNEDPILLKEELGDVLLQIVFHSQFEQEEGRFDFSDVADGICKKLIIRHPHVFSDVVASNPDEALESWNNAKMKSKNQSDYSHILRGISKALPALMRATKVQKTVSKFGFNDGNINEAFDRIEKNVLKLKKAINDSNNLKCEAELGNLLFSVVNLSGFTNVDSEYALSKSCDKFIKNLKI